MKNQYLMATRGGIFCDLRLRLPLGSLCLAASQLRPKRPAAQGSVSGPLQSSGVLTFGPGNVLFVGDMTGAKIHAFALRPADLTLQTGVELGNFHNFEGRDHVVGLDQKLAALFGTTIDKIVINDIAVHQPTQQVFLSVERGRGIDAIPAIVKVNHGKLEVLELDSIPHSQVSIPNEPDAKTMLEFDQQRIYAITDVKYYNGEIFVSGITNQRGSPRHCTGSLIPSTPAWQPVPWRSGIQSTANLRRARRS